MLFCKHKTKHAFQIFPTLNAAAAAIIMSSVTTTGTQYDVVELNLGLALPGSKRGFSSETNNITFDSTSSSHNSPPHKIQAVGWPPVRASRKNVKRRCKYVKVAVDGAPYLRKVDLETYESYDQLLTGLETMFCCLTVGNHLNERKLMDLGNGAEYVPTYEDRDGDWMLAGDVPWKMFVESCKRIRLMIKSEATGLEIRKTDSKRRMMKLDEKYI